MQYGISCLKRLNYDRQQWEERRRIAETANVDVLVWSNDRLIRFIQSIGLKVGIPIILNPEHFVSQFQVQVRTLLYLGIRGQSFGIRSTRCAYSFGRKLRRQ